MHTHMHPYKHTYIHESKVGLQIMIRIHSEHAFDLCSDMLIENKVDVF